MNKVTIVDTTERVGWTFAQALGGAVAGASSTAGFGGFGWQAALISAGTAAGLCLLKVLGVNASTFASVLAAAQKVKQTKPPEPPAP